MTKLKFTYNTRNFRNGIHDVATAIGTKIGVRAVSAGLKPLKAAVKYRIPKDTGTMASSIIANARSTSRNKKRVVGLVGSSSDKTAIRSAIKRGKSADYKPSSIIHIVEYGRKKWRPFKGRKFMEKSIRDAHISAENEVLRVLDESIAAINKGATLA